MSRVVVTGIGTINPIGKNVCEFFDSLDKGLGGACPISLFDASRFKTRFACEVKDFNIANFGFDRKDANKNDRYGQFALVASAEAIRDSGLDLGYENKERIGVIIGSGVGGIATLTNEIKDYVAAGEPRFSPFLIPKFVLNIASGQIAIKYGFTGPNFAVSSACATSSNALAMAAQLIQLGKADVMVAGGSEAPISEPAVGGFNSMHAMSTNNDEYQTASRPFDRTRDGFVIGEGAGVLILESLEHALSRNARIYAEISGTGMTDDAYHLATPHPDGLGAAKAMTLALEEAHVSPEDVGYINVHGTSTPLGDIAELEAIKKVFGKSAYSVNISSTKSMTGHLLGAGGAVEAIACIHAIESGIVPPTINFKEEDPGIDYSMNLTLNNTQKRDVRVAVNNSFGFGGQNGCIVFSRFEN